MISYAITRPSWFSSLQNIQENGHLVGELKMLKKFSYALAEARMPQGIARFGYRGWNTRSLFIQDAQGKDMATVKSLSWWKRDATVDIDGKTYEWKQKDWWGMRYGWYAPGGKEIMEFRLHWMGMKSAVEAAAQLDATEILLLFFGVYLLNLQEMESAAAGTGAL